jgi:ribosomal protein S18 acetylase RimI-like enzyme
MGGVPELTIRPIEFGDLDAMYAICVATGDAGADARAMYSDPDLLGHIYVGPYVMMESGFGFALDARTGDSAEVLGYAVAAADTAEFEAECEAAWWPALRRRYPAVDAPPGEDSDAGLIAMIHAPEPTGPEILAEYPAHLHVDLLPDAQGLGAGRKLMDAIEDELRARGAPGVHLGTDPANVQSQGFYSHIGYRRLAPGELGTAESDVIYVKRLANQRSA